jgi:mono/diheme cytochrome c family protein
MDRVISLMALVALSIATSQAAEFGDPRKGLALVHDGCAQCHATRKGEPLSPHLKAPTFVKLATTPGMTAVALNVALITPHAGMPMFMFSTEEREDIIAYILSLK